MPGPKPLLIFDGDCRFCRLWIERWRESTGDRVDYQPAAEAAERFPEIGEEEFAQSVQWIGSGGECASGARAVFLALAEGRGWGRCLLGLYRALPFFAMLAEAAYRFVAHRRTLFSRLTAWLWGREVRRPTYAVSSRLFLHALGVIYLIAFLSYFVQCRGLLGEHGILPAGVFFERAREYLGPQGFWQLPSLCWWLGGSESVLLGLCAAGVVAAGLLALGLVPAPALIVLWASYLSLCLAGQDFYQFQWDSLLLEAGFLAIFLAPWTWRLRGWPVPPRAAHSLLLWLLFRLMFAAGIVKLSSGDPSWADGSALTYHFFTQPLPTPIGWYAQQLPAWWQWMSVKLMFFIELALPFFLFLPRRLRLAGAAGLAFLQVLIALTGNYGFFNFLTLALCLLAVDDAVWRRRDRTMASRFLPRPALGLLAAGIVLLSLAPLLSAFRQPWPWLRPLALVYESVAPFRSLNGYGLFAVMTTERREITVQGSADGVHWKDYVFRFKPGPVDRSPPWVAPYMPRLDWQMWFAALGRVQDNPWFMNFLLRLLQGSPEVLDLLETNPFPDGPPRYLRAQSDDYFFTTVDQRRATRAWWRMEPAAIYCPEVSLPR